MRNALTAWRLLCVLLCGMWSLSALAANDPPALKGIALVIGESAYQALPQLPNPVNDARAVDRLLSDLGFEVNTVLDGDSRRIQKALDRFVEDAGEADVALIYYSGHGIEAGGDNFLVPVDSAPPSGGGAVRNLVPVGALIDRLQQKTKVAIVLLDACRNNPFPPGVLVATPDGAAVEATQGGLGEARGAYRLSSQPSEALGAVIGFAAEPGKTALDGDPGGNSPYAAALLKHLSAHGYDFGDVMTMVSEEVYLKTRSRQLPWTNTSLRRLLYFGLDAEQQSGDEHALREGRRSLLLKIASTPSPERALVEQVASTNGVPLDALYGMLDVLGVQKDGGDLAQQLSQGAERLKSIMASRDVQNRQDPEIVRLAGLADSAEQEGAIGLALQFRERASARARDIGAALDEAEANIAQRRLELAATFRANAETASLNFDFAIAADLYGQAYDQAKRWDVPLSYELKVLQGESLADQGFYKGDNAALERSLDAYREALVVGQASPYPRRDAGLKGNMAIVMTQLASRASDDRWLDAAAETYKEVLSELHRKTYPADWANVQLNLGALYQLQADRAGDTRYLDLALQAYRDAAKIMSREVAPEAWAGLQMNIGNVQATLAERKGNDQKLYRDSVKSIEAALEVWTRDAYPVNWALAEANLGASLRALGSTLNDATLLKRSIEALEGSSEISTRERQPMSWAGNMMSLGSAYLDLAGIEGDADLYQQSIDAYRAARSVLTVEADPNGHAGTWYNEGRALLLQARHDGDAGKLDAAQTAVANGLQFVSVERNPIGWARGRSLIGEILAERGRKAGDRQMLLEARQAFEDARQIYGASGMGTTGQSFWDKQIARIDKDLRR